jgi:hypothetical protein
MKRIDTQARAIDLFGAGKDGFKAAVPGVSDPTYCSAKWFNFLQEAIVRTIEQAGMVPSDDYDQFAKALAKNGENQLALVATAASQKVEEIFSTNLIENLKNIALADIAADVAAVDTSRIAGQALINADTAAVGTVKNAAVNTTIPAAVAAVDASKVAAQSSIVAKVAAVDNTTAMALNTMRAAYYGALAIAPTLRPDSSARQVGDRYYDTAAGTEKTWNGSIWYVPGSDSSALALSNGAEKIGRYGQNLSVSLQNRTGGAALKKFIQKLMYNANDRRLNVRLVGTSISAGASASHLFATALAEYFGRSNSAITVFAGQAEQPIAGWKAQYYSGTFSVRLRGGNGDSATPIAVQPIGKSITVFYGTETDGGNMGVSIQTANGAVVVQAPINCNGATSINNSITYALDPNFNSTIMFTPPVSGFGYPEYFVVDAGDMGMMFSNVSYGGSSLWNHVGTPNAQGISARVAIAGMYPSAVPSGNKGLVATFAPTDVSVKPDLLIYSGPTNDAGDSVNYAANLLAAVTLAIANGSSCILVIEPINGSTGRAIWDVCRAAYYSVAAAFPDSVFVYDFDAFISPDLVYNTKFHGSTSDPHPGDYGYGSPHVSAGNDLCARMGVPFQKRLGRVADSSMSRFYTQPNEPMQAAPGSVWTDTSNGAPGVRKTLISRRKGRGTRGLWSCATAENITLFDQSYLVAGNANFGSFSQGANFLGDPAFFVTSQTGMLILKSKFTAGQTYTFSYQCESLTLAAHNALLVFGSNPFLTGNAKKQAFVLSGSSNVSDVLWTDGPGDITRYVCTVKWPTQSELDAASAAGVNLSSNYVQFTFQGGTTANPLCIWDFRVELGAALTNGTFPQAINQATSFSLAALPSPTEPLATTVAIGGAWRDTSNSPSILKRLIQPDVMINASAGLPGVFGSAVGLWRGPSAPVNLLEQFSANANLVLPFQNTAVKGNYGPGNQPGIRWDIPSTAGNSTFEIESAAGTVNLILNAVYTLSFLVRCGRADNVIDNAEMTLHVNVRAHNYGGLNVYLQTDLVTWNSTNSAWKYGSVLRNQQYKRVKLTFKAYASAIGADASNLFNLQLLSTGNGGQWAELSEFRLELGASVTAD